MNAPAQVKLGDCVRLAKGKPPAQQPYYGADSAWYLSPEYLRGAAACERAKPRANAVHVQDGNTILLWDGSNAGEVFLGREGMLASTMTLVSPDNRFTSDYFFFALKQWEPYLKGQTSGSGIPHVDKEVLGKLEITEFAKPEQSKIAEVLSTVDRAIAQTEALIAKQQRIKTGLMQDLLTRGIDKHGQLRSEATHAFKDSTLGRIPVEWKVARLADVADISSGITLGKSHDGPDTVELPYLRVANVQDGFLDLGEIKTIRIPSVQVEKYRLQNGDVLMNEGGDFDKLGRGTVWRAEIPVCLHQNHVFKVRPARDCLLPDFLAYVSSSPIGKAYFVLASKQSTNLASINSTQLKAFDIPLPDYAEQLRLQEVARQADEAIKAYQARFAKLRLLKTALMQDLLTGKVRVTPLLQPTEAESHG